MTHIRHAYDGAEVFFPDLSKDDRWELAETIAHAEDPGQGPRFLLLSQSFPATIGGHVMSEIYGRNPVIEALKSGTEINRITIAKGAQTPSYRRNLSARA